jgi:hypothetical protein
MRRGRAGLGALALCVGGSVAAALSLPGVSAAAPSDRQVAPGVVFHAFTRADPAGPQEVRVLRFRLPAAGLRLEPVLAADHGAARMTVPDLVLASGAVAAVNGDFFTPDGNSRGVLLTGGVLRSEPEDPVNGAPTPRADGASTRPPARWRSGGRRRGWCGGGAATCSG